MAIQPADFFVGKAPAPVEDPPLLTLLRRFEQLHNRLLVVNERIETCRGSFGGPLTPPLPAEQPVKASDIDKEGYFVPAWDRLITSLDKFEAQVAWAEAHADALGRL